MRKSVNPFITAFALMLGLFATATAEAGEAIEALRGDWLIISFNEEPPPAGSQMILTFVDDQTVKMSFVLDGNVVDESQTRYEATEDGNMKIEDDVDGSMTAYTWEVRDDGQLHLISVPGGDPEHLVMRRP
ncbi:MAG: hypothetical protein AAGH88_05885 [Planctomycetota bacterium]